MEFNKFLEQLQALGIEIHKVKSVCKSNRFSKLVIDNAFLNNLQMRSVANLPCFVSLGIDWAYAVPRIEICIDCTKLN